MKPSPHVTSNIISASAGTGKTYRLAARYISLLALGVSPRCMVALTFTRKAAQEFQERIIRELSEGAANEEGAARLANMVRSTWKGNLDEGIPPLCPVADEADFPLTRERFGSLLRKVVEEMSGLQLSTMDSFFQKLVNAGRSELGLRRLSLVTEGALKQAQRKALDALLYDVNRDEAHWEENLAILKQISEKGEMDLVGTLQKAVEDYGELYRVLGDDSVWGNASAFHLGEVQDERLSYDEAMELHKGILACVERLQIDPSSVEKVVNAPLMISYGNCSCAKEVASMLKKYASREESAAQMLCLLLEEVKTCLRRESLRMGVRRTQGVAYFMRRYLASFKMEIQDHGYLEYADFTRMIPRLLQQDGAPSLLAYRMDARLKHWMLDEFQDTSRLQWKALVPLVQGIAEEVGASRDGAADRSLFVVGDVKQSIYRWRGGDAKLFRDMEDCPPWNKALQPSSMNLSWRSSPVIMEFANRIFKGSSGYQEHQSAYTSEKKPGYVRVVSTEPGTQAEAWDDACFKIREILESLPLLEKAMSVGILVRSNSEMQEIDARLKRDCPGLPLYQEGRTLPLSQSPLGETLLSLFRWIRHPGDAYRKAVLVNSPLWGILPREAHNWQYWRKWLREEGYGGVLKGVGHKLSSVEGLLSPCHRDQLEGWEEAALTFDAAGGTLQDWIAYMETKAIDCPPPRHSVHITTIHASKGLEYDVVILPLLAAPSHAPFNHGSHLKHYMAYDRQGGVRGLLIKDADLGKIWEEELEPARRRWSDETIEDGRNLLYVALTRAIYANYIILNGKQKSNLTTFGGIIKGALGLAASGEDFAMGDEEWAQRVCWKDREGVPMERKAIHLLPPAPRRSRVSPSQQEGREGQEEEKIAAALPFARSREAAMSLGTQVHALFEGIGWWDEASLPGWYVSPETEAQQMARRALDCPEIRDLFLSENFPEGTKAYNEQHLEAAKGTTWTSAVIDRLIVLPGEAALILDFKTDRLDDDERLRQRYGKQMEEYRRLTAAALDIPTEKAEVMLVALGGLRPHLVTFPSFPVDMKKNAD